MSLVKNIHRMKIYQKVKLISEERPPQKVVLNSLSRDWITES